MLGITENKMETLFFFRLGFYRDSGKGNGNYHVIAFFPDWGAVIQNPKANNPYYR